MYANFILSKNYPMIRKKSTTPLGNTRKNLEINFYTFFSIRQQIMKLRLIFRNNDFHSLLNKIRTNEISTVFSAQCWLLFLWAFCISNNYSDPCSSNQIAYIHLWWIANRQSSVTIMRFMRTKELFMLHSLN